MAAKEVRKLLKNKPCNIKKPHFKIVRFSFWFSYDYYMYKKAAFPLIPNFKNLKQSTGRQLYPILHLRHIAVLRAGGDELGD